MKKHTIRLLVYNLCLAVGLIVTYAQKAPEFEPLGTAITPEGRVYFYVDYKNVKREKNLVTFNGRAAFDKDGEPDPRNYAATEFTANCQSYEVKKNKELQIIDGKPFEVELKETKEFHKTEKDTAIWIAIQKVCGKGLVLVA